MVDREPVDPEELLPHNPLAMVLADPKHGVKELVWVSLSGEVRCMLCGESDFEFLAVTWARRARRGTPGQDYLCHQDCLLDEVYALR